MFFKKKSQNCKFIIWKCFNKCMHILTFEDKYMYSKSSIIRTTITGIITIPALIKDLIPQLLGFFYYKYVLEYCDFYNSVMSKFHHRNIFCTHPNNQGLPILKCELFPFVRSVCGLSYRTALLFETFFFPNVNGNWRNVLSIWMTYKVVKCHT